MNWSDPVDFYCERTGEGLLAEPVNALTNFAFIIMAIVLWRQFGQQTPVRCHARPLAILMVLVGLGSLSLHTLALRWTALLDVAGIALFILFFISVYLRQVLGQNVLKRLLVVIACLLSSALAGAHLGPTASYLPAWLILCAFAAIAHRRKKAGWAGLAGAAVLFVPSALARAMDHQWCHVIPLGTHFIWHLCNAGVLYLASRGLCEPIAQRWAGRPTQSPGV